MMTRIRPHHGTARSATARPPRPVPLRATLADPIKPPSLRVFPSLQDADLDGPVVLASPRGPLAARLIGIFGPIVLALFLTAGYAFGLKLYTHVSPLETCAIRSLAGLFALFLIAVWPTFANEGPS
jgi:hypothetical protein